MIQLNALYYIFYNLIFLFPQKITNLFAHLFIHSFSKLSKAKLNFTKYRPNKIQIIGGWLLGLIIRILDIIAFWSLLEFISSIFKWKTRSLTKHEIECAKIVFENSIQFDAIKINESSFFAKMGAKNIGHKHLGFVFGHTINFSRKINSNSQSDIAWLIHEITHVSQFEKMGLSYTYEALFAQKKWGYTYRHLLDCDVLKLKHFNLEQQADIARDYYLSPENYQLGELVHQLRTKDF